MSNEFRNGGGFTKHLKHILNVSLFCAVLFLGGWLFGVVKQAFIIAVTATTIKFVSGGVVSEAPLRSAVAGVFVVTAVSFLAIFFPIGIIPVVILALTLCLFIILIDYKTPKQFEVYSRVILVSVTIVCIIWPRAWGVNELFYGIALQALGLHDLSNRGMDLIDEVLIKYCRLV